MSSSKPLRIGVLFENTQLSDITSIDILGNMSKETVDFVADVDPRIAALAPLATPMEFLYIASSLEPSLMTPSIYAKPTHTYENAPRDLDILLIGGPKPTDFNPPSLQFMKAAVKKTKVVMTTCSGGMWLAASGVLDGKKATTNRFLLDMAKQMFPKVEWQDQRWVVEDGHHDGAKIWTAGGAGCGIDMMAQYALQTFEEPLVRFLGLGTLDFDLGASSHGQFYDAPPADPVSA